LKKIVGDYHPRWGCASKILSFSRVCKKLGVQHLLGAKIWSSDKVHLDAYDYTSKSGLLVDHSSIFYSGQCRRNCGRWNTCL